MLWLAINKMSDEYTVEAATEEEATELASAYFEAFAKEEWAGCYGKRRLAATIRSIDPIY